MASACGGCCSGNAQDGVDEHQIGLHYEVKMDSSFLHQIPLGYEKEQDELPLQTAGFGNDRGDYEQSFE